ITFTAANALSGSGTTVITVTNTDRAPTIAAPAASGAENTVITPTVHAAAIDGNAITSLTANLTGLPFGNNAVFTTGPGDTTGTLIWTPTYNDAGTYPVSFTAGNALSGSASTSITVIETDRPPTIAAPASVSIAEASPITVHVHAADVDG